MSAVKLLAIFAENKTGQLARVTSILAEAQVNIRWTAIASVERFGVIKLLVDKRDLAYQALRQYGLPVSFVDVLAIEVEDRPGGLFAVAECLAQNQVNVENASGFVCHEHAVLLIETTEPERAQQVLSGRGLRLLTEDETLSL